MRGTAMSRYDGNSRHAGSPWVFMYDHWLSRSSDRLAQGLFMPLRKKN